MWYMLEASQQQAEAQAKQHAITASSSGDKEKDKDKDKDKEKDTKDGDEGHEKDKSHTSPTPAPVTPPAPPSPMRFTVGRNNTCLLTEQQFPSRWHGLHDLWLVHVPSYLQDRLGYVRYLLRWAGLLEAQAYAAAVAHVKAHCRLEVDVLAAAEAMEAVRKGGRGSGGKGSKGGGEGASNTSLTSQGQGQGQGTSNSKSPTTSQIPATSTSTTATVTFSSADLAQLERQYPVAKRPGEDFRWYQTHCRGCGSDPRPAPPEQRPVDLYEGMLLNFPPQKEIWLFTNGYRRYYGTDIVVVMYCSRLLSTAVDDVCVACPFPFT
jgi:hypothetical protein